MRDQKKKTDREKEEGGEGSDDEDEDDDFLKTNKVCALFSRTLCIVTLSRMRKTMVKMTHFSLQAGSLVDLLLMLRGRFLGLCLTSLMPSIFRYFTF